MKQNQSIANSPHLMGLVEQAFVRLDDEACKIGQEVAEELGEVGALMIVLSTYGACINNLFMNLAVGLGEEWSQEDKARFSAKLQALLQEENERIVNQHTGDSN